MISSNLHKSLEDWSKWNTEWWKAENKLDKSKTQRRLVKGTVLPRRDY